MNNTKFIRTIGKSIKESAVTIGRSFKGIIEKVNK